MGDPRVWGLERVYIVTRRTSMLKIEAEEVPLKH
jgi:hypothetical protein